MLRFTCTFNPRAIYHSVGDTTIILNLTEFDLENRRVYFYEFNELLASMNPVFRGLVPALTVPLQSVAYQQLLVVYLLQQMSQLQY